MSVDVSRRKQNHFHSLLCHHSLQSFVRDAHYSIFFDKRTIADFRKLFVCLFVTWILVWMIFHSQFSSVSIYQYHYHWCLRKSDIGEGRNNTIRQSEMSDRGYITEILPPFPSKIKLKYWIRYRTLTYTLS